MQLLLVILQDRFIGFLSGGFVIHNPTHPSSTKVLSMMCVWILPPRSVVKATSNGGLVRNWYPAPCFRLQRGDKMIDDFCSAIGCHLQSMSLLTATSAASKHRALVPAQYSSSPGHHAITSRYLLRGCQYQRTVVPCCFGFHPRPAPRFFRYLLRGLRSLLVQAAGRCGCASRNKRWLKHPA